MKLHPDLQSSHWFKFSLIEQLANVGCDIERTIQRRKRGDLETSNKFFYTALALLDLTIADPKNIKGSRKELLRMREMLIDYFVYDNEYASTDEFWQKYFFEFNYAVAIQKGK